MLADVFFQIHFILKGAFYRTTEEEEGRLDAIMLVPQLFAAFDISVQYP